MSGPRTVRAPRGTQLTCKSWLTEAPYRMIQNNLDPEVAERPQDLVVYGGRGQAARSWEAFDAILESLKNLEEDETLLVQSGKPVVIFKTHRDAPKVLIANSNIVPHWATWEHFDELAKKGLIMYGQMTAGSWIYIGTQGILQGTYETFGALARLRGWDSLKGKFVLTAGLGGMGGAQPLAITMNGGVCLAVEVDEARPLLIGEGGERVVGAAHLEGAHRLEALGLEPGAVVPAHERGAQRHAPNPRRGRADLVDRHQLQPVELVGVLLEVREDETFQVLEGEYEFTVDGKSFVAEKGTTIFAPRGVPHTYRYLGRAPGRLMCVITPAGFEGFFEAIGALTPHEQQDIPRVLAIGKEFGLEILPPPQV